MGRIVTVAILVVVVVLALRGRRRGGHQKTILTTVEGTPSLEEATMSTVEGAPSLYERLGGEGSIRAVVDEFYIRVLKDDTLQPLFTNTDMDKLRRHQAAFISQALGGPTQYSGRSMQLAHRGLGITDEQFGAVAGHLSESLASFSVSQPEIDEVIGNIAPLRDSIVGQ